MDSKMSDQDPITITKEVKKLPTKAPFAETTAEKKTEQSLIDWKTTDSRKIAKALVEDAPFVSP